MKAVLVHDDDSIQPLDIISIQGQPIRRVKEALERITGMGIGEEVVFGVTGAGAAVLRELIGAD